MNKSVFTGMVIVLWLIVGAACAQEDGDAAAGAVPAPATVETAAVDGLTLKGDYWAQPAASAPEDGYPAVLLLHMLGRDRDTWRPLVPLLLDAGWHVLAVDLRGHGATGGERDWPAAQADALTWLDWLKNRSDTGPVAVVGASIGGNLALLGCADAPDCVTVIALSPGLDYQGVSPLTAVVEGLTNRPVLLVAAHGDEYSADSVRQLASAARGEIGLRIYPGGAHGTNMFDADYAARVKGLIVNWLTEHQPVNSD